MADLEVGMPPRVEGLPYIWKHLELGDGDSLELASKRSADASLASGLHLLEFAQAPTAVLGARLELKHELDRAMEEGFQVGDFDALPETVRRAAWVEHVRRMEDGAVILVLAPQEAS